MLNYNFRRHVEQMGRSKDWLPALSHFIRQKLQQPNPYLHRKYCNKKKCRSLSRTSQQCLHILIFLTTASEHQVKTERPNKYVYLLCSLLLSEQPTRHILICQRFVTFLFPVPLPLIATSCSTVIY